MTDQTQGRRTEAAEIRFDGRVALVTGGGTGIGRQYALGLGKRGAKVVVNGLPTSGHRPQNDVRDEIVAAGGVALAIDGTVGDDADARRMVQTAVETFGRIDILVNNAGTAGSSITIEKEPDRGFQDEFNVHLIGPLQLNRAAWPHMVAQRYGRIIFTGSACALGWYEEGGGFPGSYASAKSSLFGATRQTAAAGRAHNITANLVMPWAFTPQVQRMLGQSDFSAWMQNNLKPQTVVAGALYMLHEDCPASGQAISIAGGRITRILFASPPGYFNRDLTPEAVRDNWQAIFGQVGSGNELTGMMEIASQTGEYDIIAAALKRG